MNSVDIYSLARQRDIRVKKYSFMDIDGICTRRGENQYVWIREWMTEVQARETIAHEMGHLIDGTEDHVHVRYAEWNAEKIWREILIPYDSLIKAIEEDEWVCDASTLACKFWVSMDTMMARINDIFKS